MPPKRQRVGGGGGGGEERGRAGEPPPRSPPSLAQALKRRCRSFDLEIRCCSCCRHHQELHDSWVHRLEATMGQFKQEVTQMLTSIVNRLPDPRETIEQSLSPTYKLTFDNRMSDKIFTKREVRAADGNRIKIRMISRNQQGSNLPCLLSNVNVKIVVLDGDFNADNREIWTSEEFDDHVVRPRDKVGVVLTGKLDVKLEHGEAYLPDVTFIDNSSFTRSRKFRLGVKLIGDVGEQVQEGISEPFTVKDRRGEGYKKNDIPSADDELWRLKHIRKNGTFQQALEWRDIFSVKDFLRQYHKDENALRNILPKASQFVWTTIVDHAKKCDPGSALYSHFVEDKNIRLYFSSVGQIVGASVAGQYNAFGDLDMPWKVQVEESSRDAYDCVTYHQPDYEMYNSQPRPINWSTLQGSVSPRPRSTDSTVILDQVMHEADEQDTSSGNGFSDGDSQHSTFEGPGSVQVQTLPTVHEDNETDASIDIQLDSHPQIQYGTPDANCNTSSAIMHSTTAVEETIESVTQNQGVLAMHQENYQMNYINDGFSLGQWYSEEQVASQYVSPFSPSIQADRPIFSTYNSFNMDQLFEEMLVDDNPQSCGPTVCELPTDVHCGMTKLPSCGRWVKLSALVKWKAKLRASKRAKASV